MNSTDSRTEDRVLIVSASMGAGHDRAAAELARRLTARGHATHIVDVLGLGSGRQGQRLRVFYGLMLRRFPWVYDLAMRFWARFPRWSERFTAVGARAYERGLLTEIQRFRPDAVVSTYNLASQALGRLVRSGHIDIPVATYVTDPGAHPYWVTPDVPTHFVVTPETVDRLVRVGAEQVIATGPLVRPDFMVDHDRAAARRQFGLPENRRIALVTAGSWGVGHIERTAGLLAASGSWLPVTLCGHDKGLRQRLTAAGVGVPLGWTDDVPALMSAADALVDNAGGLTCLEALVSGLPVIIFRPLPGHGRLNARTLEDAGLARYAADDVALLAALDELEANPDERAAQIERGRSIVTGDVATEVLKLAWNRRAADAV